MLLRLACLVAASGLLGTVRAADAQQLLLYEDFESGLPDRWIERGFPSIARKNQFSVEIEPDGNRYLQVSSDRSTSGKGIWLEFDPTRCATVGWRWKISNVIANADLTAKEGDDCAAKLYVVLDGPSRWNPLDKRLLVYVWDNRLPRGTILPNA